VLPTVFTIIAILSMSLVVNGSRALAADLDIHHSDIVDISLLDMAPRGEITFRLREGRISSTGAKVYFVLSDASDKDFCREYGCIRADSLADVPEAVIEEASFDEATQEWVFLHGAGYVTRSSPDGHLTPPVANPDYSPLKRITWQGKQIIVNVPFVKWGEEPGQTMLVDRGGCDPLIRAHQPNPFLLLQGREGGPPGCVDGEDPLMRYKGAQATEIDLESMTVTMKLHESFHSESKFPHYVVWDASKGPAAGFMGTPHTPKTGLIGRRETTKAVGNVIQFANGTAEQAGGPNRFQGGLMSYAGGQRQTYSPMWHITWLFFDLDGDGIFFDDERNVSRGAIPVPGSGIPSFDPADPFRFNPFGMDDCCDDANRPDLVAELTGGEIRIFDYKDVEDFVEDGIAIETEGPPGLELNSPMQPPLIVNCPAPLTVSPK
jgi:hypothetical protein